MAHPKFLFDECVGRPAVGDTIHRLRETYGGCEAEFAHVLDFQAEGELDNVWIPKVANGYWILITSDGGKSSSRGGKLPALCRAHKITHVVFSGAVHNSKQTSKIQAVVDLWKSLLDEVAHAVPGSEYRIQYNSKRTGFRLVASYKLPSGEDSSAE